MNNSNMLLLFMILSVTISHIKSKPQIKEVNHIKDKNNVNKGKRILVTLGNNNIEELDTNTNIDDDFSTDSVNETSENDTIQRNDRTRLFFPDTLGRSAINLTNNTVNRTRHFFPGTLGGSAFPLGTINSMFPQQGNFPGTLGGSAFPSGTINSMFPQQGNLPGNLHPIIGQGSVGPQSIGQNPFGAIYPPHQPGGSYPGGSFPGPRPFPPYSGNFNPFFLGGLQNSGSCLEWCRSGNGYGSFYCCPGKEVNRANIAYVEPQCPAPRPKCPNVFRTNSPVPCTTDQQCWSQSLPSKCCQDACLNQYVCKPALKPIG